MRRFNSSSPGMQTTAIRLKSLKPFILRRWAEAYAFVYKNITGWMVGWLVAYFGWLLVVVVVDWLIGWLVGWTVVWTVVYIVVGMRCWLRWLLVHLVGFGWASQLRNTLMICLPLSAEVPPPKTTRAEPSAYKLTHTWWLLVEVCGHTHTRRTHTPTYIHTYTQANCCATDSARESQSDYNIR